MSREWSCNAVTRRQVRKVKFTSQSLSSCNRIAWHVCRHNMSRRQARSRKFTTKFRRHKFRPSNDGGNRRYRRGCVNFVEDAEVKYFVDKGCRRDDGARPVVSVASLPDSPRVHHLNRHGSTDSSERLVCVLTEFYDARGNF